MYLFSPSNRYACVERTAIIDNAGLACNCLLEVHVTNTGALKLLHHQFQDSSSLQKFTEIALNLSFDDIRYSFDLSKR